VVTRFTPLVYGAGILAFLSKLACAQEAIAPRSALNLVTNDTVLIARPAQVIWPMILHESAWKKATQLTHADGPKDAVGEIFAARGGDADSPILFYLQTMELLPLKRRTLKLYNVDGPLIGFASWELDELHGETRVTYRVYAELPTVAAQGDATQLKELQSRYTTDNETRFRAELNTLKHLVEAH
jgi:hypothetical protein